MTTTNETADDALQRAGEDTKPLPGFDPSTLLPFNNKSPPPQPDRSATNAALDALLHKSLRPSPCDVFASGPLLVSNIPANAKNNNERGVILGIDEAGRGPVLGPMTYAAAYWNPDSTDIPSDFNDSKQLSAEKRATLFKKIQSSDSIGFVLVSLSAESYDIISVCLFLI